MLMQSAKPLGELEDSHEFAARHIGVTQADQALMLAGRWRRVASQPDGAHRARQHCPKQRHGHPGTLDRSRRAG